MAIGKTPRGNGGAAFEVKKTERKPTGARKPRIKLPEDTEAYVKIKEECAPDSGNRKGRVKRVGRPSLIEDVLNTPANVDKGQPRPTAGEVEFDSKYVRKKPKSATGTLGRLTLGRKEVFAQEFVLHGLQHQTECAKIAGYSPHSAARYASKLMNDPWVQERIQELNNKAWEKKIMQGAEVLGRMSSIARREETEDKVMTVGVGGGVTEVKVIETRTANKDALNALDMLGKYHGVYNTAMKDMQEAAFEKLAEVFGAVDSAMSDSPAPLEDALPFTDLPEDESEFEE